MIIQTKDGEVKLSFDATENEFCAQMNGFSGYGKTQEKAIALCLAVRRDTLQGEDED